MHYPSTPHLDGNGNSRLFPSKLMKTNYPVRSKRLSSGRHIPISGEYFSSEPYYPIAPIIDDYTFQSRNIRLSPARPSLFASDAYCMDTDQERIQSQRSDSLPVVDAFDQAAHDTLTFDTDPHTQGKTVLCSEKYHNVKDIRLYMKLAKGLAKSQGSAFLIERLSYGKERVLPGKHARAFEALRTAPSLSKVQRNLPNKRIHPYAEYMLQSLEGQDWRSLPPAVYMHDGRYAGQHFNDWLDAYRRKINSSEMKDRVSRWEATTNDLYKGAVTYLNSLFDYVRARLLVLRIDFGVRVEHQESMHVFQMRDDFLRMLKNSEMNSLFDHMVGYIWRLEYTEDKSYHYHCIFLFDGSEEQYDAELADKVGKYWVNNITDEKGTYWNCNASPNHYKRRGIGMIDYRDTKKRQYLVNDVLPYLTVVDNDIRLVITADAVALGYEGDVTVRTFGRGTVRKEKKTNRGRPRQLAQGEQDSEPAGDGITPVP